MTKETLTIVLFSIGSGLIGYAIGIAAAWLGCGFHADSDTHSTRIRTVIPR
ncbi:hypothetical protein N1E65_32550 [Pseudomonas aeruginosa]|nr:hypothetical protein [Pseudomonas aeruginosa]MCS9418294.1 hypothetical protein [Pseudomonas aeruginosa]MCS9525421.1 hypothetical protein [Pseudomonas aeruginosa]